MFSWCAERLAWVVRFSDPQLFAVSREGERAISPSSLRGLFVLRPCRFGYDFVHHHPSAHSRANHLCAIAPSVDNVRFQLSRVGHCNCFVRRMASSSEIWCAGEDECLHPEDECLPLDGGNDKEPQPEEQFLLNVSSLCRHS